MKPVDNRFERFKYCVHLVSFFVDYIAVSLEVFLVCLVYAKLCKNLRKMSVDFCHVGVNIVRVKVLFVKKFIDVRRTLWFNLIECI